MTEAERRTEYVSERVLIDAERILDPQFVAQGIFLSGAQVELLRNVTAYLGRDTTFVDSFRTGYYLKATGADFDSIQAVVADLEDKLMTADNTPWGYNRRYIDIQQDVSDVAGTFTINLAGPDLGNVWRVMGVSVYRNVNVNQYARLQVVAIVTAITIEDINIPVLGRFFPSISEFVVSDVDNIRVQYTGATIGEIVITTAWGYKMVVP